MTTLLGCAGQEVRTGTGDEEEEGSNDDDVDGEADGPEDRYDGYVMLEPVDDADEEEENAVPTSPLDFVGYPVPALRHDVVGDGTSEEDLPPVTFPRKAIACA